MFVFHGREGNIERRPVTLRVEELVHYKSISNIVSIIISIISPSICVA